MLQQGAPIHIFIPGTVRHRATDSRARQWLIVCVLPSHRQHIGATCPSEKRNQEIVTDTRVFFFADGLEKSPAMEATSNATPVLRRKKKQGQSQQRQQQQIEGREQGGTQRFDGDETHVSRWAFLKSAGRADIETFASFSRFLGAT